MKSVWNRAAADSYSLAAVRGALAHRGRSFRDVFAGFGAANLTPGSSYQEGAGYPATAVPAVGLGSHTVLVRRLANRAVAFRPGGNGTQLRIDVAVSARENAAATVIVRRVSGAIAKRRIRFDADGRGHAVVPFAGDEVRRVDLVLTNADPALDCWKGTTLSCSGVAHADRLRFTYEAARAQ